MFFYRETGKNAENPGLLVAAVIAPEFMKKIIIGFIALALCVQAKAQENMLTTTDGTTYTGITLARVEPDGLYIEYTPSGGGFGMSKVKFSRLTRAQQKLYGFNKEAARDYEAAVAQANTDMAQDLIHRHDVERETRRQRDLENERAYPARMAEIWRVNAAQAAAFYSTTIAEKSPTTSLVIGAEFTSGHTTTQTSYSSESGADIFPNRGITTKSH